MALRFFSEFDSYIRGKQYRVEIHDSEFGGTETEFKLGENGFEIRFSNEDNERHTPIIGTEVTVDILITDSTIEALITDIAASKEGRFTVGIFDGVTRDSLYWCGRVLSDISVYEDLYYPYAFALRATDGIGALKEIDYKNGSSAYTGDKRLTEHVVNALGKLNHLSNFYSTGDIMLRTAVDWWEDSMTNSSTNDPVYLTWLDHTTFYDFKDSEKNYLSCYDVLVEICRIFGARLIHYHGAYWIEQISVKIATSFYARGYDITGSYVGVTTIPGTNTIDQTPTGVRLTLINYDFLPPLNYVRIDQHVNNRRNYLAGYVIDQDLAAPITIYSAIDNNSSQSVLRLTGNMHLEITNTGYTGNANDLLIFIFEIKIKVGSNYVLRQYEIQNFAIQYDNAEWSTGTGSRVSLGVTVWPTPVISGSSSNYDFPLLFNTPVLQGSANAGESEFFIELVNVKKYDGTSAFLGDFDISWSIENPWLEVRSYGNPALQEDTIRVYATNNDEGNTAALKYETIIGDSANPNTVGRLKIGPNATSLESTDKWGQGTGSATLNIVQLLSQVIINGQLTPCRVMHGTLSGGFYFYKTFTVGSDKYLMMGATWNAKKDELTGDFFLLNYAAGSVVTSPIKKKKYPATIPPEGIYDIGGANAGTGASAQTDLFGKAPSTVIKPVAQASTDGAISAGSITTIAIQETLGDADVVVGDTITIMNPLTGYFEDLTVTATSTTGQTSISVSGTLNADYPIGSYLIKKPLIGAHKLPGGTADGQIIRWNDTSKAWEVYEGTTIGNALVWGTSGWGEGTVSGSKWTDGTGGAIYRNSKIGIGSISSPYGKFDVDGGSAFSPLIASMYAQGSSSAYLNVANSVSSAYIGLALGQDASGGTLPFQLLRYGSAHGSTPSEVHIRQQDNAPLSVWTNAIKRFEISGAGAYTFNALTGSGNKLVQIDASGVISRSTLDPASIGTVTGIGVALRVATWSSASALTNYGQHQASRYNFTSATPYAAFEIEGLQADPLSTAGPTEDSVLTLRAMTSGGSRALPSLSFGVWLNSAPNYGVWMQSRSTGAFNTLYPILAQPRGGKFSIGRVSSVNNSAWFTVKAGASTSSAGAGNYIANFEAGESIGRIGIGSGSDSVKSFLHMDGSALITRVGMLDSSTNATIRFSIGSTEALDKVIIMPTSNGRLGAGFSSTSGLHSTMQSSGSFATNVLTPFAAPTIDETKRTIVWNTNSSVTFTLPSASACQGREYWFFNRSNTGIINLSTSVSKGAGGNFSSISAGQWAFVQADDSGSWIGFKLASL